MNAFALSCLLDGSNLAGVGRWESFSSFDIFSRLFCSVLDSIESSKLCSSVESSGVSEFVGVSGRLSLVTWSSESVIDGPSREFDDSTLGAIGLLGSENKFLVAVSRVGIEL